MAIPTPPPGEDFIQVVLPSAGVIAAFDAWLAERGVVRFRMPLGEEDIPTYGLTFPDPPTRS